MKIQNCLRLLALGSFLVMSGCLTCCEIMDRNTCRERKRKDASERKETFETTKRLAEDFEVVFRDSNFLIAADTSARRALNDYFLRINDQSPSQEQFAKLVDVVKERSYLAFPLKNMWFSRQATIAQRVDFAKVMDRPRGDSDSEYEVRRNMNELLERLLPMERIGDDVYLPLQKQVMTNGYVHAYISEVLQMRVDLRKEAQKRLQEFKSKRVSAGR